MALHLQMTKFAVRFSGDLASECAGDELRRANDCDEPFCRWIEKARVGDKFTDGGGAAPEFEVERVQ